MVGLRIDQPMQLVYPYCGQGADMVCWREAAAAIETDRGKPLIVYKEQGVYTDEIYDIYGY